MAKFINTSDYDATIHREILDSLLRKESATYDPQIIEICEDRAIAEMKGYLNKTYDCEKSSQPKERKETPSSSCSPSTSPSITSSASTIPTSWLRYDRTDTTGPSSGSRE